jgi:hypothetical protein
MVVGHHVPASARSGGDSSTSTSWRTSGSRRIVGFEVHEEEAMELSAALVSATCAAENIDPCGLVLHSDNGGPMHGSTMLATLQRLGIVASFSRPKVSDRQPLRRTLFRPLKYRPEYPQKPFESIEAARAWGH